MRQSHDHFSVGGKRAAQSPDRAAQLDQPRQLVGNVLRDLGHHLRVQLFQLALHLLEGAEVNRRDERRRIQLPDRGTGSERLRARPQVGLGRHVGRSLRLKCAMVERG